VKAASILEMLNVPAAVTRPASLAQVSDESPQTFKESMVVASKASPVTGAAKQTGTATGRRQTPHAKQDSDPPQVASVLFSVTQVSQIATNLSNTVANIAQSALLNGVPALPSNAVPDVYTSGVANAVPSVSLAVVQTAPSAEESAVPNAVPRVAQSALSTEVPTSVPTIVPNAFTGVFENAASPVVPTAIADASLHAASPVVPTAIADTSLHAASPVVPTAIADTSLHAASAPVLHGALNLSAGGEVAPKSSSVSTSQANRPAATPDQSGLATGLSVPGAAADQLVALIQPGGGLLVAAQTTASSLSPAEAAKPSEIAFANGKDGANNTVSDTTELKQHAQAASDQTGSQAGSQGTPPSGDQSQGGAFQQGQNSAPIQITLANQTIAATDQAQNAGVAAPLQAAPTPAGLAGHTASIPETAAPASIALPQAVPVINTAKLIQSMGQSEMRVGMRSNDFGSISISTSATRDLISAQISVDHGELARTIATHLPEMEARLGGSQAMDVRIEMNGQATGQGPGTSPGMSNGSADGSRGDRQQKGSAGSSQSADGFAGQRSSIAVAGLPSGEADARLDIRA
jgi:hypothetical protein